MRGLRHALGLEDAARLAEGEAQAARGAWRSPLTWLRSGTRTASSDAWGPMVPDVPSAFVGAAVDGEAEEEDAMSRQIRTAGDLPVLYGDDDEAVPRRVVSDCVVGETAPAARPSAGFPMAGTHSDSQSATPRGWKARLGSVPWFLGGAGSPEHRRAAGGRTSPRVVPYIADDEEEASVEIFATFDFPSAGSHQDDGVMRRARSDRSLGAASSAGGGRRGDADAGPDPRHAMRAQGVLAAQAAPMSSARARSVEPRRPLRPAAEPLASLPPGRAVPASPLGGHIAGLQGRIRPASARSMDSLQRSLSDAVLDEFLETVKLERGQRGRPGRS